MKQAIYLSLAFFITTSLHAAWLDKPDASDVSETIKEAWRQCKLVKPDNFKKVNGIDNGRTYQIAISYTLEITRDIAEEEIWHTKVPEYITPDVTDITKDYDEINRQGEELNAPRQAAIKRIDNFYSENCPYPLSTHFQAYADANHKHGSSLAKGEILNVTMELIMIRSENGWIIQ